MMDVIMGFIQWMGKKLQELWIFRELVGNLSKSELERIPYIIKANSLLEMGIGTGMVVPGSRLARMPIFIHLLLSAEPCTPNPKRKRETKCKCGGEENTGLECQRSKSRP